MRRAIIALIGSGLGLYAFGDGASRDFEQIRIGLKLALAGGIIMALSVVAFFVSYIKKN